MEQQFNLATTMIAAALQVLVFAAVPFITYVATRRRVRGFLEYVGLRPVPRSAIAPMVGVFLVTALMAAIVYVVPSFREVSLSEASTGGQIAAQPVALRTFAIIVVIGLVQTSFAEELLFRGFVAKRLIAWLGFQRGNVAQAAVFVAPHLLVFVGPQGAALGPLGLLLVIATAGVSGWLLGWLNEHRADGSIIPSWLVHGTGNVLAYSLALLL